MRNEKHEKQLKKCAPPSCPHFSFLFLFSWLFILYCVDENMKFCLVRFFLLINTHTVLALRIQLSNSYTRISYYTPFSISFSLSFTFFWSQHFSLTCLLMALPLQSYCFCFGACDFDVDDGGDGVIFFYFRLFSFEIIYSFAILFTVSIQFDSMQKKEIFIIILFWLFFKQQNWISKWHE